MEKINKLSRSHQAGFNAAVTIMRKVAKMNPETTIKEFLRLLDNSKVIAQLMEDNEDEKPINNDNVPTL